MRRIAVLNSLRRLPLVAPKRAQAPTAFASRCRQREPPLVSSCCVQQQQHRSFGEYYKLKRKKKKEDPFKVLGVSSEETYAVIKKAFIRIAMKYHPDTAEASTPEKEDENRNIFITARNAFEAIAEGPDGIALLRDEADLMTDEELDNMFQEETGHHLPFMDPATMKEVAKMTETMGGGLDRDGGMWTLARMVTESVKSGGDGKDILKLEAGDVREREINGILRRKRRR